MNKKHFIIYFEQILKSNKIDLILHIVNDVNTPIDRPEKIDLIIKNLCFLKIDTIKTLIDVMKLKPNNGKIKLYIKAVECSSQIFGFINFYYTIPIKLRIDAFYYAAILGKIDIMKKIRGLSTKNLEKLRELIESQDRFTKQVKGYVIQEHRISRANKSSSPEDILKKSFKSKKKSK